MKLFWLSYLVKWKCKSYLFGAFHSQGDRNSAGEDEGDHNTEVCLNEIWSWLSAPAETLSYQPAIASALQLILRSFPITARLKHRAIYFKFLSVISVFCLIELTVPRTAQTKQTRHSSVRCVSSCTSWLVPPCIPFSTTHCGRWSILTCSVNLNHLVVLND